MIESRELTHRYGDVIALDGVSVTIQDGEFALVLGPNGSGKTTFVRHFNGLLGPDDGEVLVNGQSVQEDLLAARTAVGMVFQNPRDQIVSPTVAADVAFGPENLGLSRAEIDRRVESALQAVEMTGRDNEQLTALSGGELARVAIAGALAMEPDHLVLDEPFAGLDSGARDSLVAHITALNDQGTSIIVVTHDPHHVREYADSVLRFQNGQLVQHAPADSETLSRSSRR